MPHTYDQNIVHLVFSTKDRRKTISEEIRAELWAYIAGICKKHRIFVHAIGGVEDHIHLLVVVPAALSLADAVLAIKANSSRWMGERSDRFAWQHGYAAFSVSASNVAAVVRYIRRQEEHHRKMTFEAELVALLRKHGWGLIRSLCLDRGVRGERCVAPTALIANTDGFPARGRRGLGYRMPPLRVCVRTGLHL